MGSLNGYRPSRIELKTRQNQPIYDPTNYNTITLGLKILPDLECL